MTEAEYEAALVRIYELMDAEHGDGDGSPDAQEMDELVTKVVAYEDEHYPIRPQPNTEASG